ncbi:hypothetical protein ES703_01156 [subsurface metagenome]
MNRISKQMDQKKLKKLLKRRTPLLQNIVNNREFMRDTVVTSKRPCTYPGCRLCKEGKKHTSTYILTGKDGRTKLVYVPHLLIEIAKEMINKFRRIRTCLEEIFYINFEIFNMLKKDRELKELLTFINLLKFYYEKDIKDKEIFAEEREQIPFKLLWSENEEESSEIEMLKEKLKRDFRKILHIKKGQPGEMRVFGDKSRKLF